MYTNSAVVAVVVEIGQNVIKRKRLKIFFWIISVLYTFELGCHLGTNQGTLVNQGPPIGARARFNTKKIDNTYLCYIIRFLKKRKELKTRWKILTLPIFIRFSKFQILLKAGKYVHIFVAMPFLCILHGYATFRRFCCKSDIYTHFWTFSGDFAIKLLCGWKAPWLNLSTGFGISKIGQELTKLQSFGCLKSTNLKKRKKLKQD
jgi:hypothetical protein